MLLGFVYWVIHAEISRESSFLIQNTVRKDGLGSAYSAMLRRMLHRLDLWLCPPEALEGRGWSWRRRAWNWKAYDRMLLLAVIYPFALPMLFWMLFNWPGDIGGLLQLSPSGLSDRLQAAAILLAAMAVLRWNRPIPRAIHAVTIGGLVRLFNAVQPWCAAPPNEVIP